MNKRQVTKSSVPKTNSKFKKLVAWMVSRCHSASRREQYVLELQEYINVDVYGNCENAVNDKTKLLSCPKHLEEQCWNMIDEKYKVSFEIP